jgi:O-antigen ligase
MTTDRGLKNFSIVISMLLLSGIVLLTTQQSTISVPGIAILALILFFIAFIDTDSAIIILIFSMLLSPEFGATGGSGRNVVVRADDLFLVVIFISWMSKMAINKELGLLRSNPLNRPILIYIFVSVLATLIAGFQGLVNVKMSFFYILKYTEYFLLFFMVSNNLRDTDQVKTYVLLMLVTCFIVSGYAWYLKFSGVERVAAPFDMTQTGGEANTLAGYLLLLIAVVLGLLVYSRSFNQSIALSGLLCFIVPPFLFTLSRGAWVGFVPMYLTMIIMTRRSRFLLVLGLILIIVISPLILPKNVKDRVDVTFESGKTYTVLGKQFTLAESGAVRVDAWSNILKKLAKRPALGYGVTGAGFIDSQFVRVLGETGLIGLVAFLWIIGAIIKYGKKTLRSVKDDWARGLTLGFLAGFIGLLVQSFSASTFIIVRIMEPFWFLTAIIVMLPEISLASEENMLST